MLNPSVAYTVIDHAIGLGAHFAELFVEQTQNSQLEFTSGEVSTVSSGIDSGIGVRLFVDHRVLYGFTNSTDREELIRIARTLLAQHRTSTTNSARSFGETSISERHPSECPLSKGYALESKVDYLRKMDAAARSESDKIVQFIGKLSQKERSFEIFNSDGLHTNDTRNYVRIVATVIAQDGDEQTTGYEAPGALRGWEYHQQIDAENLAKKAARGALIKLGAADCPSGELPVVIGPGFGGVIFHEACGHLLETTSVQKKASVFHDQMGHMIASPVVSAVDDGLIPNEWGSLNIDDEGMETQRTQLIKDGRLVNFLVDHMGSLKTGYARTGSGRRQDYRFAPASRMRNTFIEGGTSTLDEMVGTIDRGIYAKKMGGGSVVPGTGEFNFAVLEPYLIENGTVTRPLKSATLISTGPKVLKEISMVGRDFELAAGMCGSVSGAIPTTVGQPSLKVDRILVGGQQA